MKVNKWGWLFLGLMGISIFILQVFVFESPDEFIGYLLCMFCFILTICSFIKLFKISKTFHEFLKDFLELLFF